MYIGNDPTGGDFVAKTVCFTGFNINATAGSRTAFNADLKKGMVLQFDPFDTQSTGQGDTPPAGQRVGTPTASALYNFCIVADHPQRVQNDLEGTTANLRKGGGVKGIIAGDCVYALVVAGSGLSIGQALAPGTAAALVATDQGTPTGRVGANARAWAVLLETLSNGAGTVLAKVQILQN